MVTQFAPNVIDFDPVCVNQGIVSRAVCKTAENVIDADGLLDIQALWISRPSVSAQDRKVGGGYDHMQPV